MTWLTSQSFILYFFITSFFVSHSLIVQLCQFFLSFFITFFLSFSLTSQYLTSFFSLSHFLSDMSKWRITFQAPPPLLGIPSHTLIPLCKESLRLGDSIYPAIVKVPEFKKKGMKIDFQSGCSLLRFMKCSIESIIMYICYLLLFQFSFNFHQITSINNKYSIMFLFCNMLVVDFLKHTRTFSSCKHLIVQPPFQSCSWCSVEHT